MSVSTREIAGVGIVTITNEAGVEVNIVGSDEVEAVLTPRSNTKPDTLYAVSLQIDGEETALEGVEWTPGEVASLTTKSILFSSQDLTGIKEIIITVSIDASVVVVAGLDASIGVSVTGGMEIRMDRAPKGVAGFVIEVTIQDPGVARIVDVTYPATFSLATHDPDPVSGSEVQLRAADLGKQVESGARDILLATLNIEGLATGISPVKLVIPQFDDDDGFNIKSIVQSAFLTVTA